MRLWNYAAKWTAANWGNNFGALPFAYDHVTQPAGTDTFLKLDAVAAPQLQAQDATPAATRGLWEADVTLPQLKDGLVVAPLWLWDSSSRDEIDFELAGRNGLDLTLHVNVNGSMQETSVRLFAGHDMSGERHRFGIQVDETAGYVTMYLDGVQIQRWDRATVGYMVSHALKPIMNMWPVDDNNGGLVYWAGNWQGVAPGETLTMTIHGYLFTPLP